MSEERRHHVTVSPLPAWLDRHTLLGPADWTWDPSTGTAYAQLPRLQAADLQARLRGQGFAGVPVTVDVRPRLARPVVREARLVDARRRRDTSPGFTRPGTRLDEEGKRSLTPEAVGLAMAERLVALHGPTITVRDVCCGAGGNAIAFARSGLTVHASDLDAHRVALAAHNARIYGVSDRIHFTVGDAVEASATPSADLLWVDPPWGDDWQRTGCGLQDLPLLGQVLDAAGEGWPHTWCKVPPSFDPTTTPGFAAEAWFGVAEGDRQRVKLVCLTR